MSYFDKVVKFFLDAETRLAELEGGNLDAFELSEKAENYADAYSTYVLDRIMPDTLWQFVKKLNATNDNKCCNYVSQIRRGWLSA